ncbi:MAG: hypothetical protein ACE5G2_11255 [Candidatus Krumholzibacteriia bacterium]
MTRRPRRSWARTLLLALLGASLGRAPLVAAQPEVKATRTQLRDAWLSVDAAVVGTYAGLDSTLGPLYHVVEVDDVWMGSAARGQLVFKAPRGIRAEPGNEVLLMLWDRLIGATDSYLETSSRRYGERAWQRIGPDSLASYLLPFSKYAFPLHKGKLVLRGTSVFKDELKRKELHDELLDFELTLLPEELYRGVDVVVRARVVKLERKSKVVEGVPVEYRIYVDFETLEELKGDAPATLHLEYSSFPRSPRFDQDEEVILFLTRTDTGLFLKQGKRAVCRIVDGAVETGQPVREFVRSLKDTAR